VEDVVAESVVQEARVSPVNLYARVEPSRGATWVGLIAAREPFRVYEHGVAPGCDDWGRVDKGAWACLDDTELATGQPVSLPRVDPGETLAGIYAKLGRSKPGPIYRSKTDWDAGKRPVGHFEKEHSYAFVRVETTERGDVLVAADGRVVPVDQAEVYQPSVFTGRDLAVDPLPPGATLGWCVESAGCTTADGTTRAFQEAFLVQAPVDGRVRTFQPAPRPAGVGDAETWIDVHLAQQTLAVMVGDTPRHLTLVSAGAGGRYATPTGTFRVQDKYVDTDMLSLPGAADVYHVERVPWAVHFRPRFALHGAYWHGKFGLPMSHGCVNLSPADAHVVFDQLRPEVPPGWRVAWATREDPGTVIRVR